MKTKTLKDIFAEFTLTNEEGNRVKELIKLNDGTITWSLLRSHLTRGSGFCMRLYESLVQANLATPHQKNTPLHRLPPAKRSGFM